MFPVANLGPLAVQTPGLILLLGVWICLSLVERSARHGGLDASTLYHLAFTSLLAGVIGARLAYAALHPQAFLENPLAILALSTGMFNLPGGLFTGLVCALVIGQKKRLPLWPTLDAFSLGLAVFAVFVSLSHLAAGSAFGRPTNLPWAIDLWGELRHPTQVYAMLAFTGIAVMLQRWQSRSLQPEGTLFWRFAGLAALSMLFLEFFRADSHVILGSLRTAQIAGWLVLALALQQLGIRQPAARSSSPPLQPTE